MDEPTYEEIISTIEQFVGLYAMRLALTTKLAIG